jgi:hypothetical protein
MFPVRYGLKFCILYKDDNLWALQPMVKLDMLVVQRLGSSPLVKDRSVGRSPAWVNTSTD